MIRTLSFKSFEWKNSIRVAIQKFGTLLSGMIMPIIGIIIAWGLITSFFIPTGWTPVKVINDYVVGPTISYLIPILIGFLGGRIIYGDRGGFIGAAAAIGVVAGAKLFEEGIIWPIKEGLGPQFLGAMIVGPTSALIFKRIERLWEGKIKSGFEMLVNNFAMGIYGMAAILFSFFIVPWGVYGITYVLSAIIDPLTHYKALPVVSLFVEPAKPLFLNNAINHGIFTPLGTRQVAETGKSILFYLESNPGPGLGLLLSYIAFNKEQRGSAASAALIHTFGGIHEVYFPFIIMRPILILATMLGGAVGVAILQIFGAGALSPASPGSVIALFTVSAHSGMDYAGLAISIAAAATTSFLVSILIMRLTRKKQLSKNDAIAKMNALKGSESKYVKANSQKQVKSIIFACDAGMGSSAMGAGILKKLVKEKGLDIIVTNCAIRDLKNQKPDLVVVQAVLSSRAKKENGVEQFVVNNFLDKEQYIQLVDSLSKSSNNQSEVAQQVDKTATQIAQSLLVELITNKNVSINSKNKKFKDAIKEAGQLLVDNENVLEGYIDSMYKRNEDISVYIGNGVAIPHAQSGNDNLIIKSGISITTYPKGIEWSSGEKVYLVIGIAGKGDKHMEILGELAQKLETQEVVSKIASAKSLEEIKEVLNNA